MADMSNVYLALPSYDGWSHQCHQLSVLRATRKHSVDIPKPSPTSLLAKCFNTHYARALSSDNYDYFAMLHGDLSAENGWLDTLIEESERLNADVVSVASPIKDDRGLVSVAIAFDGPYTPKRRVTVRELKQLPETFEADDVLKLFGAKSGVLLVNTGCFVVNLRKPWVRETNEQGELKAFFTITDRLRFVTIDGEKRLSVEVEPEDWNYSRMLAALGCRVCATRKVRVLHEGSQQYTNFGEWGRFEHDEDYLRQANTAGSD